MIRFIREADVARLVTLDDALESVESALRLDGEGRVTNPPRSRVPFGEESIRISSAVVPDLGHMAVKVSPNNRSGSGPGKLLLLYESIGGRLLALIEVFRFGLLRTGAAGGIGVKHLARSDASVLGVIGPGRQARLQVAAIRRVRQIERVVVSGRNSENVDVFCNDVSRQIGLPCEAAGSAQACVEAADVLVTATPSSTPVFDGRWLKPGTHVNAIGSNYEYRQEIDDETVRHASVIAVDNLEQARCEAGDLLGPISRGVIDWSRVSELGAIIAGRVPGRHLAEEITVFESLGIALEDVAFASTVFRRAEELDVGQRIELTPVSRSDSHRLPFELPL